MSRFISIVAVLLFNSIWQDAGAREASCGERGCITTFVGAGGVGHIFYPNSGMRTIA